MLRRFSAAFLLAFLSFVSLGLAQTDTLVVIHINDTHSHLVPYGPKNAEGVPKLGGLARAAHIVRELQARATKTLELHGGDLMVGDFMYTRFRGIPEIRVLKSLGWDVWTIGNHEFDEGPDFLDEALAEADVPDDSLVVISANLDLSQHPGLAGKVRPYTIRDYGDFKVGIFGLTPTMTNDYSRPSPVVVTDPFEAAAATVDSLRGRCDILLCLSHLGFGDDQELAARVGGIDVIVGGHSHTAIETAVPVLNPDADTTWIVQAGAHYNYVGTFRLVRQGGGFVFRDYRLIPVDDTVEEDPEVARIVQALKDTLAADPRYGDVYGEVIGQALVDMDRKVGPGPEKDTPVGNLITDALREAAGTDVAFEVHGYISDKLWAGPITPADVFHIAYYGYDARTGHGHNVLRIGLTGSQIRLGLEYTLKNGARDSDLWPEVSGMRVVFDSRSLLLLVKEITVGGEPINPDSVYSVALTDKLAEFLGAAGLEPMYVEPAGVSEYMALVNFVRAHTPIEYHAEGRIYDRAATGVEEGRSGELPTSLGLRNWPNPFNQSTVIAFTPQTGARGPGELYVVDARGRRVRTLWRGQIGARRRVTWDGTSDEGVLLPSGLYLAVLRAPGSVVVRKMLLLR